MNIRMSKADSLSALQNIEKAFPAKDSPQSVVIAWWTDFTRYIEQLRQADSELAEYAVSVVGRLRVGRIQLAALKFNFTATSMEIGAEIVQKHPDEIQGLVLHMLSSLKGEAEKEDTITRVGEIVVNSDRYTVAYGKTTENYQPNGLPWSLFSRCASDEHGEANMKEFANGAESDAIVTARVNKEISRINKTWKEKEGVRLLSVKGGVIRLAVVDA